MTTRWVMRLATLLAVAGPAAGGAELRPVNVAAASGQALGDWSARVDRLVGSRELVSRQVREDTMIPGRTHERLVQLHRGLPVFGAEIARQSDAAGTLSVFGTLYEGIDVEVAPGLSPRHLFRDARSGILPVHVGSRPCCGGSRPHLPRTRRAATGGGGRPRSSSPGPLSFRRAESASALSARDYP